MRKLLLWTFFPKIYEEIKQSNEIKMSIYFDEAVIKCYHYYQPTILVEWQGNGLSYSIILVLLCKPLLWTVFPKIYKEIKQNNE